MGHSHIRDSVHLAFDSDLTNDVCCCVVLPYSQFEVVIHSIFAQYRGVCLFGPKGLSFN